MRRAAFIFVFFFALGLLARLSLFTVEEGRAALVIRWGNELSAVRTKPGVQAKMPDPLERAVMVDTRGQTLSVSSEEPDEKDALPALSFDAVWRVADPALWWKNFGSGGQAAEEVAGALRKASREAVSKLSDPDLVRRGDAWIAGRVKAAAEPVLKEKGIALDSVRVAGIRMSAKGLEKAVEGTSRTWNGEIRATGRMEKESAAALRRAADDKAQRTLSAALAQASAIRAAADAAADRDYAKLEAEPGLAGISARLSQARRESRAAGKPVPMPAAAQSAGEKK